MFKRLGMFDRSLGMFQPLGKFAAVFTPAELFASGEQGTWYDPSDWTTLFQDSAGTLPVTAVEQPVGLMLDKSKGLALGPEVMTNGDFSSSSGWILSSGATIGSGILTFITVASNSGAYQSTKAVAGTLYKITFTCLSITTGGFFIGAGSGAGPSRTAAGTYTDYIYVPPSSVNTNIGIFSTVYGTSATFDNMSVVAVAGNHASQSTTTSRPILRNRYNMLTYTEDFSAPPWLTQGTIAVTQNAAVAPNGTTTATRLNASAGVWSRYQLYTGRSISYKASAWVKAVSPGVKNTFRISFDSGVISSDFTATETWQLFEFTGLASYNETVSWAITRDSSSNAADLYVWGASLVVANESHLPYQWVTTGAQSTSNPVSTVTAGYDTDTTKFPPYLYFDGTDDWLQTGNINFSATDKMSVFAGVRKLSDSTYNTAVEQGSNSSTSSGFGVWAPGWGATGAKFGMNWYVGGVSASDSTDIYPAPITALLSFELNISVPGASNQIVVFRVNGVNTTYSLPATAATTGYFANKPLYIGRRGGTTLPFNGRIYSLITRGALTTTPLLEKTEQWVATKTGVTL